MEPIRVLQLFTILNRGGAETNIMNYYRKMDRTKFQFDFLVHREEIGAYEEEIVQLGGKIFRLPALHPLHLSAYKKAVRSFFDQHDYKIIHGQCSELGLFIYKEAKKRNVPVIIAHAHNSTDGWNLKSPFRWFWKKRMMNYINAYFTCSYEASIWLFGKKNAHKAFAMHNAVESSLFAYNENTDQKIRKNLEASNTTNIIHVGRFNEQKNHGFLIDVFSEYNALNPNAKLFLVGEGALKKSIIDKVNHLKINDNVVFLGLRNDVNLIMQGMDFFLFPSLFEGLPVSFVEAQSSGLQCVISDKIPAEAILIPENVTVISLKKSAKYWARQMHLQTNFQRKNVSQIIIEKGYDIHTNLQKLEDKYLDLLEKLS